MLGTIHVIICSSMLAFYGSLWYFLGGYDTYFHTEWTHIKLNPLQLIAAYSLYGIVCYPILYTIDYHLTIKMMTKKCTGGATHDMLGVNYEITHVTYEDENVTYFEMTDIDVLQIVLIPVMFILLFPIVLSVLIVHLIKEHKRDFKLRFNKKYRIKTTLKD